MNVLQLLRELTEDHDFLTDDAPVTVETSTYIVGEDEDGHFKHREMERRRNTPPRGGAHRHWGVGGLRRGPVLAGANPL